MLISLLILLLLSNALISRRDKSILFSRVVILCLISTSFLALNNLFVQPLEKGIGIYGGLFNVTTFTQTFNIFIFIISAVILTLTAFFPRKAHHYYSNYLVFKAHVITSPKGYIYIANFFVLIFKLSSSNFSFSLEDFILYANTSDQGTVDGGSSTGYQADTSRSPSVVPGALVDGLSYREVQSIRSDVHSYVVNTLKNNPAVAVSVSDILINTNNSNTYKVLEKAYSLASIKYDLECIVASRNLGDRFSVNYSPPMQKLIDMK